jgi:hypothetical protein
LLPCGSWLFFQGQFLTSLFPLPLYHQSENPVNTAHSTPSYKESNNRRRPWLEVPKTEVLEDLFYDVFGLDGDSSPGRDSSSVIPSLSLQLILRRKKTYTTNSEILGRVLGRTM